MTVTGFPIDDPDKPWTKDKVYKDWVKTIKTMKRTRRSSRVDLCRLGRWAAPWRRPLVVGYLVLV